MHVFFKLQGLWAPDELFQDFKIQVIFNRLLSNAAVVLQELLKIARTTINISL